MRTKLAPIVAGLSLAVPIAAAQEAELPTSEDRDERAASHESWTEAHRGLRVLYAGYPEGSREVAFEGFLGQWFDKVGTINLEDLSMETAKEYDVVIADWMSQYGNDGYPKPSSLHSVPCNLDEDFTKPVIAMTYVGTNIRRDYKLDWL